MKFLSISAMLICPLLVQTSFAETEWGNEVQLTVASAPTQPVWVPGRGPNGEYYIVGEFKQNEGQGAKKPVCAEMINLAKLQAQLEMRVKNLSPENCAQTSVNCSARSFESENGGVITYQRPYGSVSYTCYR